jgi:hypothetical protein
MLHAGVGFAFGVAFAAMLVLLDAGGLGNLFKSLPDSLVALVLLEVFCGLTFGSLTIGWAAMALPYADPEG